MRLLLIACRVLWRELSYFAAQSPHVIEYAFLPQGLHVTPETLREELQKTIDAHQDKGFDALLLGYGLCCNGIVGIRARDTRLVIPKAHDCITFLLGSKERYKKYFDENPTAYWYSPGWIDTGSQPSRERRESSLNFYREKYGEENAEYLMETLESWMTKYNKAVYVDLGVGDRERYLAYTKNCAQEMGWEMEELQGDPSLIIDLLRGSQDESRFLIVSPGKEVAASFDEKIITTK